MTSCSRLAGGVPFCLAASCMRWEKVGSSCALRACAQLAATATATPLLLFLRLIQGDAEDRAKLRKKAEEDAKRRAREEKQDLVLGEAEALARMVGRCWKAC